MSKKTEDLSPAELLQAASTRLKKDWPGMSLRAVAAKLKISPSYWSKILRGEKPLTKQLLPRVVKVLGMDSQSVAELQRSILRAIERQNLAPGTGIRTADDAQPSPVAGYKSIGREEFWLLDDWYTIPLLNYVTLSAADQEPSAIAAKLGVDRKAIQAALARLEEKGFLRLESDGRYIRTDLQVRFPTDRSHSSVRKFHLSMIERALSELKKPDATATYHSRLISGVNLAGSSEKIQEAKLILEEAMYRAANLMAEAPDADRIYQLNVQIFPLTP